MNIIPYRNHVPREWMTDGSFLDRNPNMSYLLSSEQKDSSSILIDASGDPDIILQDLKQNNSTLKYILFTHNHLDHTYLIPALAAKFPAAKIGIHTSSLEALSSRGLKEVFALKDGMIICLGDIELLVVHAPGHTKDSACFWDRKGNNFFSGDVIFGGGIGCADYHQGGNRNIFYQTIDNLMQVLPASTKIFPGHYSEHYQSLPPYDLATEKIKNPYITNVMQGKRGDFDRDLKEFSIEFEPADHRMLNESDIDKMCAMEEETWIPQLQASRETMLTRLHNGHQFLAIEKESKLTSVAGWCYSKFSIEESQNEFPMKFAEFSTCKSCSSINAKSAFIYNVGVIPSTRKQGTGGLLLQWAFEKIHAAGIHQVFLDSRLPSYNGSRQDTIEHVEQNPEFKKAIDRYFSHNQFPSNKEFALDPVIRFYMKNGFSPWLIRKDFIEDKPSENIRVICYINLDQDDSKYQNI